MKIISIISIVLLIFYAQNAYAVTCQSKLGSIKGDIDLSKEGGSQQEWNDYYTKLEQVLLDNFNKNGGSTPIFRNGEPAVLRLESTSASVHDSPVQFYVSRRPARSPVYSHQDIMATIEQTLKRNAHVLPGSPAYDKAVRVQDFMYNRLGFESRNVKIPKDSWRCREARREFFDIVSRLESFDFSDEHLQVVRDLTRIERYFLYYGEGRNAERILYYLRPDTIRKFLLDATIDDVADYMKAAGLPPDLFGYLADPGVC